jgi:signal-transduction protein with cAMP-binding, CBS, and nucleotidyltransferase domain
LTDQDSVQKAAVVMAEAEIGFLPICDAENRVIGVVTARDLTTRALAKQVVPGSTSAAMVMSSPAITCLDTANVRDAEELMATERKAHLVIVDAAGKLVGVLSLANLLEHAPGLHTLQTLHTVRAVLSREALGARGGAAKNQPLLKDDPAAQNLPVPSDDLKVSPSVFTGGHQNTDTKEFPG